MAGLWGFCIVGGMGGGLVEGLAVEKGNFSMSLVLKGEEAVDLPEALEAEKLGGSKHLVLEDREEVSLVLKNDQLHLQVPGLAGGLADFPFHWWIVFQFQLSSVFLLCNLYTDSVRVLSRVECLASLWDSRMAYVLLL